MNKQALKKIEKQIKDSFESLRKLEIRPCNGDKDIKQRELEITELKSYIKSLEKERDRYLYHWNKEDGIENQT